MLEEQLLDPRHHNRKTFRCGVPVLDRFLAQPGRTEPPPGLRGNVRVGGYALLVDAKNEPAAQAGSAHGLSPRSAPMRWAQAKPLKATALSPWPGKQESPTQ